MKELNSSELAATSLDPAAAEFIYEASRIRGPLSNSKARRLAKIALKSPGSYAVAVSILGKKPRDFHELKELLMEASRQTARNGFPVLRHRTNAFVKNIEKGMGWGPNRTIIELATRKGSTIGGTLKTLIGSFFIGASVGALREGIPLGRYGAPYDVTGALFAGVGAPLIKDFTVTTIKHVPTFLKALKDVYETEGLGEALKFAGFHGLRIGVPLLVAFHGYNSAKAAIRKEEQQRY